MAKRVFRYKTEEEFEALEIFPEPQSDDDLVALDGGGLIQEDGPHSKPGYVYFASESGETNYFKVGLSGNPKKRRVMLQTGNPRCLSINPEFVQNMWEVEKLLLEAMKKRYPQGDGGREWFLADDGLDEAQEVFMDIVNQAST